MYDRPGMRPMSTSNPGCARRSFISGSRLWPPARILASGSSSSATASWRLPGAAYANFAGNMDYLLSASPDGLDAGEIRLFEGLLAAQLAASRQRRLHDVLIARAAAQVAVQAAPHLSIGRV